jgi:hypothetical protein
MRLLPKLLIILRKARHKLASCPQTKAEQSLPGADLCAGRVLPANLGFASALLAFILIFLAGCGGGPVTANSSNPTFSVSPGRAAIDTNCTGCNATSAHGTPVHQFSATLNSGGPAPVTWSVSGGDEVTGAGTINAGGQYTPPSYLSSDHVEVEVTAALKASPGVRATTIIWLTPGFLQPLTPQNVALGPNGTVTITGYLAEASGSSGIRFALSDAPSGATGGEGSLGPTTCQHFSRAFTSCTVTYTAPTAPQSASVTYVVATAGNSSSRIETAVLLNASGVTSNPASHQSQLAAPIQLGSSGGNNSDFDAHGDTIRDCCSGTLGSLIQDGTGRQFLLSNNHVLTRSDHASVGDAIVQPGLIDNNCTPNGEGPGTVPVGIVTAWLPLHATTTNVDAAIAQVASHTVDPSGSILELGMRQPDGSLAAAPPGVSSTDGKGESATLQLRVAKSGRTTGLTCGSVTALDVDISVDYYRDCAETTPYLTKLFTGQVTVSGDHFSDAGDSGALIVDAANAEPVGLLFAGGIDVSGVSQVMANPATEVLNELAGQTGGGTSFSFIGTADHKVSCLSYGDSTVAASQARALPDSEIARVQRALVAARVLVNPSQAILGVAMGKSADRPGEAAVIVYVDENAQAAVPQSIEGVRTVVIPTNAHAVAFGTAPLTNAFGGGSTVSATAMAQALSLKRQEVHKLLRQNSAFFGLGIGESLDNPHESALVIYVDRNRIPSHLPSMIGNMRTRYIVMDRLHVTRSYSAAFESGRHCLPHRTANPTGNVDPDFVLGRRELDPF